MKLNIKNKKENPVLRRIEVEAELVFTGPTPSKETIKNEIASQLKADAECIAVKEIKTNFGHQLGSTIAYVYDDVESKKEMVTVNKKQLEKEKKAAEGGAAEAPKEEKPVEEKKEEPKAEEKKEEPPKEEPKPEEKSE